MLGQTSLIATTVAAGLPMAASAAESSSPTSEQIAKPKAKVVVTGGHPGDPEYGCGGMIAPGSIGASAFPSRVMKGMRMGGRMGGDQITVKNLRVAKIDVENNLLYIRGAVPGGRNGLVIISFAKNGKRG